MSTSTASHVSIESFEQYKPYPETSTFESALAYMDHGSGLEYFQYPPSPTGIDVSRDFEVGQASAMDLHSLSSSINDYGYASSTFAPSPPNAFMSQDEESTGVAPQALFYGLSGGELSDSIPSSSGRVSRGSNSRSPAATYASVPRSQRFNPIAVPARAARAAASHRRNKSSRSNDPDSDDEDEEFKPTGIAEPADDLPRDSAQRREMVRKQRIESEQRRRDELRDGYNRLKATLPPTNQKTSKVSLLDRATAHIRLIEKQNGELLKRAIVGETEVHRLRTVNETLMLTRAGAHF